MESIYATKRRINACDSEFPETGRKEDYRTPSHSKPTELLAFLSTEY